MKRVKKKPKDKIKEIDQVCKHIAKISSRTSHERTIRSSTKPNILRESELFREAMNRGLEAMRMKSGLKTLPKIKPEEPRKEVVPQKRSSTGRKQSNQEQGV